MILHPLKNDSQLPLRRNTMLKYKSQLTADSNLADLKPNFGSFANLGTDEFRQSVWDTLVSVQAANRVIGSISAAPSRPPVKAVESLLLEYVGKAVFADEAKKMVGRLMRQIIEHLGGNFVRRGVPLNVESEFTKGSIYKFD
jgi:hypothetical protein